MVHSIINTSILVHRHGQNTKHTGLLTISGSTSATCSDTRFPSVCTVKGNFPYVLSLLQASIKPCEKSIPTTWLNLLASSKVERPTAQPMSSAILGTLSYNEIKILGHWCHHSAYYCNFIWLYSIMAFLRDGILWKLIKRVGDNNYWTLRQTDVLLFFLCGM